MHSQVFYILLQYHFLLRGGTQIKIINYILDYHCIINVLAEHSIKF
jgi:hypothetical protein